ncbi:Sugar kinase of the NBD/HSP70 family, may contain an N-terminal HTH domain [Arboricoccus pini]|uniref:Sugar kinase of the NBD/HSP70 family, may contain an N-terminal HTH domain n=1 Tax=Arboricoccus pini TaxID=1963835 RepID=A0A212PW39_9PROT|nr:ROK family protein [Arboricoccus pini]SNB51080.1 Sugar kinase of the NBD/HSP70 family, may contain an N-terminal HTH domain [Arboricoccus pini]
MRINSASLPQDGAQDLLDGQSHAWAGTYDDAASGQGANSASLRQFNERVIIKALRRMGQGSKADLARAAHLSSNTAGQIVRQLVGQRLIRERGKRNDGGRGQPATLLGLDPAGAYAIGLYVSRSGFAAALLDFAGTVIGYRRVERDLPLPDEALRFAVQAARELSSELTPDAAQRLVGMGAAIGYDMGSWRRELGIGDAAFAAWNGFDIRSHLQRMTGMTIITENDGTAAAVAELFGGHGRELDDFLYIFIDYATGGGVVCGGDYRHGVNGNAGDVGLMPTLPSKLASAPRGGGDLEIVLTRASIASLIRHLDFCGHKVEDREELQRCFNVRPPALEEWLEDCAQALVAPILAAVRVLDVPHVILDGDLPRDILMGLIRRMTVLLDEASPESRKPPTLLAGRVGREAPMLGAAILPFHVNFGPSRGLLIGGQG